MRRGPARDQPVRTGSAERTNGLAPVRDREGDVASTELESKPGQDKPGQQEKATRAISPADEPSVEWGWHGGFPKGTQIAGWFSAFATAMMLVGNHQGILSGGDTFKDEDIWLIAVTIILVIGLLIDLRKKRTSWRR